MDIYKKYIIKETLLKKKSISVYKAIKKDTDIEVIIKEFYNISPQIISNFERNKIKNLRHNGLFDTLEIKKTDNQIIIVYNNIETIPLKEFLKQKKPDIETFLNLSIQMIEALSYIHRARVVYKNINPENIHIIPENNIIKFSDIGLNIFEIGKSYELSNPELIKNILPYISPEQTNKLNYKIDYRSDYYSLGCVMFEMIFGTPPFISNLAQELIHHHLAQLPEIPEEATKSIPSVITKIIMKLLMTWPKIKKLKNIRPTFYLSFQGIKIVKEKKKACF